MITINTFVFNDFQENTYLLSNGNDCIVVDPGCYSAKEKQQLKDAILLRNLTLKQIICTHCHLDHIFGVKFLKDNFPEALFQAHKDDEFLLSASIKQALMFGQPMDKPPVLNGYLQDEDVITIGISEFKVLHIPGHSPGGICFYCAAQKIVIVGDVLFARSIGRTDMEGGNMDALLSHITKKLFTLPDDVVVYSGHGPSTTIGEERMHNPFFKAPYYPF